MANELENASSGHKLGQLVGDWFQDYFVLPMLKGIADKLGLRTRSAVVRYAIRMGLLGAESLDG